MSEHHDHPHPHPTQPDTDAPLTYHQRLEAADLAGGVKPSLGGPLRAPLGHQTGGMRPGFQCDPEHLIRGRHFQIEGRGDVSLEPGDIVVVDMTAILTQMRRNAIGTGCHRQLGRAHGVGVVAAAGISQRCHMINIDAQSQIGNVCHGAALPRLSGVPNHPLAPLIMNTVARS